jgi:general secretion pathway protein E
MELVEIYTKFKDMEFHSTPGVFVGINSDTALASIFVDQKFISTLNNDLIREAQKVVGDFKKKFVSKIVRFSCSKVQWDALSEILLKKDNVVLDPDDYDVRELEIIEFSDNYSDVPKGFLICKNLKGAIIFHEPHAINDETKEYFNELYKYLSTTYKSVDVQPVENDITVIFQEKITNRLVDADSASNSAAQRKLVEILTTAVQLNVSDIHIYLLNNGKSYYQYRIYKRLQKPIRIGSELLENVLRSAWRAEGSKVDALYSVTSSQERTLQLSIKQKNKENGIYKFRFQSSPVEGGLKTVMRVINTDNSNLGNLSFLDFGYEDYQEHQIRMALNVPDGLILVCGSTNSGKSTAISKMLIELVKLRPYWGIDSVEDPVENNLEGVAQHPVSLANVDNKNLNEKEARNEAFIRALMDLMRQDPDAINVGEIRDKISAETCRDFVNTGHKLFTTIHAKRIMGSYGRLAEIGMSHNDLCRNGFLTAVIYQSLIPTTCDHCSTKISESKTINKGKLQVLRKLLPDLNNVRIHNETGCSMCRDGIKGLTVCAEILEPDSTFNQYIRNNDFKSAENYWLNESEIDNEEFDYKGRSLEDAIIYKVYKGIICPLIAEAYLLPLEYLSRTYSSNVLFPKNKLKSISNE